MAVAVVDVVEVGVAVAVVDVVAVAVAVLVAVEVVVGVAVAVLVVIGAANRISCAPSSPWVFSPKMKTLSPSARVLVFLFM